MWNLFEEHGIDFSPDCFLFSPKLTVYGRCKREPSILLSKEESLSGSIIPGSVMVTIVWEHWYILLLP